MKRRRLNKRTLTIGAVTLLLCCSLSYLVAEIGGRSPEAQATATARAVQRETTQTAAAITEATQAALPTDTPLPPTQTPSPTDTPRPTETLEPAAALAARLAQVMDNNRGIRPAYTLEWDGPTLRIVFAASDNFTTNMIRGGIESNMRGILEALHQSRVAYDEVVITATFELVDAFGNSEEGNVVIASYAYATVERINFDSLLFVEPFVIADSVFIHPAIRDEN